MNSRLAGPSRLGLGSHLWLINVCLIISLVGLVVVKAFITNGQVARGAQTSSLDQSKAQLSNQVSQLRWQIAQYQSLGYIQTYAIRAWR